MWAPRGYGWQVSQPVLGDRQAYGGEVDPLGSRPRPGMPWSGPWSARRVAARVGRGGGGPPRTERAGFEPAMEREPHTRLAVRRGCGLVRKRVDSAFRAAKGAGVQQGVAVYGGLSLPRALP